MRSICVECGHPTNKGLTVCIYCRSGRARVSKVCEDCGETVDVRRQPASPPRNLCRSCRDRREVERILRVALPILEEGGTHADAGKALHLSGERVRQIIARHPELAHVRRKTRGERVVGQVETLLESGEQPEAAASICGISMDTLRGILKAHPGLRRLAAQNRAYRRARRFDSVFSLVQGEGLSIRAACGRLGIKCRMAIYAVARTPAAQSRFPSLAQVPCRSRIPALRTGTGRLDLPHAG